jgi:predicted RNase H-like HicB family nuclease
VILEIEQDINGTWMAGVPQLTGDRASGVTRGEAVRRMKVYALHILATNVENGEDNGVADALFTETLK